MSLLMHTVSYSTVKEPQLLSTFCKVATVSSQLATPFSKCSCSFYSSQAALVWARDEVAAWQQARYNETYSFQLRICRPQCVVFFLVMAHKGNYVFRTVAPLVLPMASVWCTSV